MRISVSEAREYWADPSQQLMGTTPDILPDNEAFVYYAKVDICLMFHTAFWDGVWMVHAGVKPQGLGALDGQTRDLLKEFWEDQGPAALMAWIETKNRKMNALARRVGFRKRCETADGWLTLKEWRPEWVV